MTKISPWKSFIASFVDKPLKKKTDFEVCGFNFIKATPCETNIYCNIYNKKVNDYETFVPHRYSLKIS